MKNLFKVFILICLLVILNTCKKDKPSEEEKLTQHEQRIFENIDGFMPKQVGSMFENYFNNNRSQKDYGLYLDSIETAIDELKDAIQLNFTLDEYEKAMNNSLLNLQSPSKGSGVDCLGLGYSKGVSVEANASGTVGAVIVMGVQAAGGGGIKTIYDFVNLERQIYTYYFCGYGLNFGVGVAALLKAGLGFSGINEVITGIRYRGNNNVLYRFEGQGLSRSFSLSASAAAVFGINLSFGVGTSHGAVADFSGIGNLSPCPGNMIEIENGTTSYSVKVTGSASPITVGFAEIYAAMSLNTTGTNSERVDNTYTKFSDNRTLAGLRMAKEICLTGPMEGIIAIPGPIDLAASTVAIIYSFKDFSSCPAEIPAIGTKSIINLASTSASSGGIIRDDRGASVTSRGVVWSTTENPTITIKIGITNDGQGTGEFTSNITSLTANTSYYVRAYATNSAGTGYGTQVSFTTPMNITKPTVTTTPVTTYTSTSATVGGNVTDSGGATVTERGVYWSTSQNPELTGIKLQIESGTGVFSTRLTGLSPNTPYYVKAYAINSQGTSYGTQVNFTTPLSVTTPTVTTTSVTNYTTTSATVGGNVTASGGATVTERGIYWSTTQNPELTGTKLQIGSGTDVFSTSLSGLSPNTPYYVKAYAINSLGPSYGTQVSFTTLSSQSIPTSGLVAYYPFNGNANDESGNGNNGTIIGATLSNDRFAEVNKAFHFDIIGNQYITIPNSTSLNTPINEISIIAWVRVESGGTNSPRIFRKGDTGYDFCITTTSGLRRLSFFPNSGYNYNNQQPVSTTTFSEGVWHQVAVTQIGTAVNFYIDGVIAGTVTSSQLIIGQSSSNVTIGRKASGTDQLKGSLDDILIYNRALTEVEIQALYHVGGW